MGEGEQGAMEDAQAVYQVTFIDIKKEFVEYLRRGHGRYWSGRMYTNIETYNYIRTGNETYPELSTTQVLLHGGAYNPLLFIVFFLGDPEKGYKQNQ